jgi:hypothetical protein
MTTHTENLSFEPGADRAARLRPWWRAATAIAALLALAGCSKPKAEGAALVSSATGSVAPALPPPPAVHKLEYAHMLYTEDGRLAACVTFDILVDDPSGQGLRAAAAAYAVKERDGGTTAIVRVGSCATNVTDGRPILASCMLPPRILTPTDGMKATDRETVDYYDYAALADSDVEMRDCLAGHGKWTADRTSYEWRHAKLEHDMAKHQKMMKGLSQ